jgi:hypothetical protein
VQFSKSKSRPPPQKAEPPKESAESPIGEWADTALVIAGAPAHRMPRIAAPTSGTAVRSSLHRTIRCNTVGCATLQQGRCSRWCWTTRS